MVLVELGTFLNRFVCFYTEDPKKEKKKVRFQDQEENKQVKGTALLHYILLVFTGILFLFISSVSNGLY